MKLIPVGEPGYYAQVDDEDFEKLNKYKWKWWRDKKNFYARREDGNKKTILMHREIMDAPKGMMTDHIDGDGLNNQKSNLRICLHLGNNRNRGLQANNTSGYKGVHFSKLKNKFISKIKVNYKRIYLGEFIDKKDAARAYNEAALKYHGDFARINQL